MSMRSSARVLFARGTPLADVSGAGQQLVGIHPSTQQLLLYEPAAHP